MNESFKNEFLGRYLAFDSDMTGDRYDYVVASIIDVDVMVDAQLAVVEMAGGVRRVVPFIHCRSTNLYKTISEAAAEVARLNNENSDDTDQEAA